MCVYACVCIYVCVYIYIHICSSVCVCVCICVCMVFLQSCNHVLCDNVINTPLYLIFKTFDWNKKTLGTLPEKTMWKIVHGWI